MSRHDKRAQWARGRKQLRTPEARAVIAMCDLITPSRRGPVELPESFSSSLRSLPEVKAARREDREAAREAKAAMARQATREAIRISERRSA